MNISIVEANMTGVQHSYPNGIYIDIIADITLTCFGLKPYLYCSKEHMENMNIAREKVIYNPINVIPGNKHMITKFVVECYNSFKILKRSKGLVIFLSSMPDVQLPMIRFSRLFKNTKILIMTHGELEGLLERKAMWKIWSYPFWISKCFKRSIPRNIYRIVLGESIKNNLKIYGNDTQVFWIDQPRDNFIAEVYNLSNKTIFGYIGDFLKKKGAKTFLEASDITKKYEGVQYWIIGPNHYKEIKNTNNVRDCGENGYLGFNEFESLINEITFACYPYPPNTYRLTASGAVLDAIRHLKPIVYIANDYFDGILSGVGDIGYRCEDEVEFIKTVEQLAEGYDINRYRRQIDNLKLLQKKFFIETTQRRLVGIINNIIEQ